MKSTIRLGVNIDHIATIRQARRGVYPDPVEFAVMAEMAGAWGITAHLREDRRHIQDQDIFRLKETVTHLNMEMAVTDEMVKIACNVRPNSCCLVPEKREELTTEGGLNLCANEPFYALAVERLSAAGILVSMFIDPDTAQIEAAERIGAPAIELHTGAYANAFLPHPAEDDTDAPPANKMLNTHAMAELERLNRAASIAQALGLQVHAGHGLDYQNVTPVLSVPGLSELNIGYSIVGRALAVGLPQAVCEMRLLIEKQNDQLSSK